MAQIRLHSLIWVIVKSWLNKSKISRYIYIHSVDLKFQTGHEVLKIISYLTQLSMEFILLINVKMPTIVGILKQDKYSIREF